MKIMLKNVRLSFPNVFVPQTVNGEGEPAYSLLAILDPKRDAQQIKLLEEAIKDAAKTKWKGKAAGILEQLRSKDKVAYHPEPKYSADGEVYAGFEGMHYVSARAYTRPTVIDRDRTPLSEQDGRIYSGCWANVSIELYGQDNAYGKRINASLRGVQFVRDDDAFGGGAPASADEFDEVEEPADAFGDPVDDLA